MHVVQLALAAAVTISLMAGVFQTDVGHLDYRCLFAKRIVVVPFDFSGNAIGDLPRRTEVI